MDIEKEMQAAIANGAATSEPKQQRKQRKSAASAIGDAAGSLPIVEGLGTQLAERQLQAIAQEWADTMASGLPALYEQISGLTGQIALPIQQQKALPSAERQAVNFAAIFYGKFYGEEDYE